MRAKRDGQWFREKDGPWPKGEGIPGEFIIHYYIKKDILNKKSKYQQIDIIDNDLFGRMLFLNGDIQIAEKDAAIYNKAMVAPLLASNVTLENIEIIYPGRGNKGLAYAPLSRLDDVPERVGDYPEFSMFGELPAWGFYVRHVDGLTLKNIKLSITAPDYRPAIVFDDVENLDCQSVYIEGDNKHSDIILHNTGKVKFDVDRNVVRR